MNGLIFSIYLMSYATACTVGIFVFAWIRMKKKPSRRSYLFYESSFDAFICSIIILGVLAIAYGIAKVL